MASTNQRLFVEPLRFARDGPAADDQHTLAPQMQRWRLCPARAHRLHGPCRLVLIILRKAALKNSTSN
ncbi:MAG: hypothetical protein ACLTCB_00775 [Merdibacter sp.]